MKKLLSAAFAFATLAAFSAPPAQAASVAGLAGPWVATLVGNTGCGLTTMYVTFSLNSAGTGNANITTHGQCGDGTISDPITVSAVAPNGAGTAHLSCGTDCGWDFKIQVLPGSKLFSLVDVSPGNPNNYLEGTAVYQ